MGGQASCPNSDRVGQQHAAPSTRVYLAPRLQQQQPQQQQRKEHRYSHGFTSSHSPTHSFLLIPFSLLFPVYFHLHSLVQTGPILSFLRLRSPRQLVQVDSDRKSESLLLTVFLESIKA